MRRRTGVRRDQLEHLIRAAGALIGDESVIVIGSQAILATAPAPAEVGLTRSMEADLLPVDDPLEEKADLIDGVLGAGSMFDDTHGIHADGVSISTHPCCQRAGGSGSSRSRTRTPTGSGGCAWRPTT